MKPYEDWDRPYTCSFACFVVGLLAHVRESTVWSNSKLEAFGLRLTLDGGF